MAAHTKPTTAPTSNLPTFWNHVGSKKKFAVRRCRQDLVESFGETAEDVFRLYRVRGIGTEHWETATLKVAALRLDRDFHLVMRWLNKDSPITVEVRLAFEEGVMRLLDEAGKTTYSRIQSDKSGNWGVVYLPLHSAEESKELLHITANPLRLGAWALKRLRPRIVEWAEAHL